MHYKFDIYAHEGDHPQKEISKLGITYQHATPQSMGDMWIFWNCENIPSDLPEYITTFEQDPKDWIGYGLSAEVAQRIADRAKELAPSKG
jgi:hypothetical protein